MKRLLAPSLVLVLGLTSGACALIRDAAWFPDDYMNKIGAEAYVESTKDYRSITSGPQYEMVRRISDKMARVVNRPEFDWEFKLLEAPDTVNAFALPGGKIAVYTGILRITQNEDALAAVIGHEIGHVLLEHGNKRMTQNAVVNGALIIADLAGGWGGMSQESRASWMGALGSGAQVGVLLPFSRDHESEADEIGLRFLIRAGYDPYEAPKLWERMAAASGTTDSNTNPMSTHPNPLQRAARLRELIPQMLAEESASTR